MRTITVVAAILLVAPHAEAQMGGYRGPGFERGRDVEAPKLPGPELDGPPPADTLISVLNLPDTVAQHYTVVRDSFMVATKLQRDSAYAVQEVMYARLDAGDVVAARFYAERLQRLGKWLQDAQDKFEDQLSRVFTKDQLKAYRVWRQQQDAEALAHVPEENLRWREAAFGTPRPTRESREAVAPADTPTPDLGSQALRIGRSVYVTSQVAIDDHGQLVGPGDLHAQAAQAFANLTKVLTAARAIPADVVRLTIYVVGYQPQDLAIIHDAGRTYFPERGPPVTTVVGVQSLSRDGLLIAVEATAVETRPASPRETVPSMR